MRARTLYAASRLVGALPDGTIEWRAAAAVRRRQKSPLVLVQTMRGGARLELHVHEAIQGTAFVSRRFESETAAFIVGHLPDRGLFVDVGANIGMISFVVAKRRPAARIIGFEAAPGNVEQWRRNRSLNGSAHATVVQAAVTDRVGVARFLVEEHESTFGRLTDEGNIDVPTTSLDAYCREHAIRRIDVLKLDIEGAEAVALRGARELLAAGAIGVVVAEAHLDRADDLDALLRPHGFVKTAVPSRGLRRLRNKPKLEVAWIAPTLRDERRNARSRLLA